MGPPLMALFREVLVWPCWRMLDLGMLLRVKHPPAFRSLRYLHFHELSASCSCKDACCLSLCLAAVMSMHTSLDQDDPMNFLPRVAVVSNRKGTNTTVGLRIILVPCVVAVRKKKHDKRNVRKEESGLSHRQGWQDCRSSRQVFQKQRVDVGSPPHFNFFQVLKE